MTGFYDATQVMMDNFTVFRFLRLTVPSTPVILTVVETESRHKNTPLLDKE